MNREQRDQYASIQSRVQRQMEKYFAPSVYRALRKQISSFTSLVRSGYGPLAALNRLPVVDELISKTIESIHLKAGLYAAKATRKTLMRETVRSTGAAKGAAVSRSPSFAHNNHVGETTEMVLTKKSPVFLTVKRGGLGFNERITADIKEYFRLHLLEKAVLPISATTRARIETVLNHAQENGWGVERILQELEGETFREMTRRRARTIVRTETVRASNYGAMAAANDSEFEQTKVWIAVKDNRTRTSHKHGTGVDGEVRDITLPFSNGLLFPGDPNGSAEETISCRCVVAFRAKRDERGRLIPKKRESGIVVTLASLLTNAYERIRRAAAALLNSF